MPQSPADSPNGPWLPCYRLHRPARERGRAAARLSTLSVRTTACTTTCGGIAARRRRRCPPCRALRPRTRPPRTPAPRSQSPASSPPKSRAWCPPRGPPWSPRLRHSTANGINRDGKACSECFHQRFAREECEDDEPRQPIVRGTSRHTRVSHMAKMRITSTGCNGVKMYLKGQPARNCLSTCHRTAREP